MPTDDPQNFRGGLKRQRRLLEESEDMFDADREPIKRWLRAKDGTIAVSSMKTYLRRVRAASERSDVPLVDFDEDAFHDLIFKLRHEYDLADSTVRSYENSVLLFLNEQLDFEWTEQIERTRVESSPISSEQMLLPEDIQKLCEGANNQRDVAIIEFLADTGARISLALSLRIRDVDLGDTPTYRPNNSAIGLKGAPITEYPLIDSTAAIRSYLRTSHPRPNDPDVALFHKIKPHSRDDGDGRWSSDGGLNPNSYGEHLKRIGDRAEVDKPVNAHNFRHSAITRMAREGFTRSQIEHRVHWTLDTDMWETYEHIAADQHNDDIFREAGIIEGDTGPDQVRKRCGQCREALAPHHEFCPNCGTPATVEAEESVDEAERSMLDRLVEETNPATRRELRALLDEIESNPDLAHEDSS